MRIAVLQYANGQMKHCDDLIEASQCFFRVFKRFLKNISVTIISLQFIVKIIHVIPENNKKYPRKSESAKTSEGIPIILRRYQYLAF